MKKETLLILGAIAAVVLVAAIYFAGQGTPGAERDQHPDLFPGIAERLGDVDRIRIEARDRTVTLERHESDRWTVAEEGGYWADPPKVQTIFTGFAAMETLEQLTANPQMHERLGLDGPEDGGSATRVTLESAGTEVASLVIGNTKSGWQSTRQLYVRRGGEDQSWLVRSPIEATGGPTSFRESVFLNIAFDRVWSFENELHDQPGIEMRRQDLAPGASFMLMNIPEESDVTAQELLAGPARALMNLTFQEVRRSADFFDELTSPSRVRLETLDGLYLELAIRADPESGDWWTTVLAEPGPTIEPDDQVLDEIDRINQRTDGFAYRLPMWRADALLRPVEEVITRRDGPLPGVHSFPGGELPETVELPEGFEQYFTSPDGSTIQIPVDDPALGQFLRPRERPEDAETD